MIDCFYLFIFISLLAYLFFISSHKLPVLTGAVFKSGWLRELPWDSFDTMLTALGNYYPPPLFLLWGSEATLHTFQDVQFPSKPPRLCQGAQRLELAALRTSHYVWLSRAESERAFSATMWANTAASHTAPPKMSVRYIKRRDRETASAFLECYTF